MGYLEVVLVVGGIVIFVVAIAALWILASEFEH
jgi:hypothetical protein